MSLEASQQSGNDYTSESTRKLTTLADAFVAGDEGKDLLSGQIEQLANSIDELGDDERKQLEELTRLLQVDGEHADLVETLSQDAAFTTQLSDDRMLMSLSVRPALGQGKDLAVEDVVAHLRSEGIEKGVDLDAIRESINRASEGEMVEQVVIVAGRKPGVSTPERLALFARTTADEPPRRVLREGEEDEGDVGHRADADGILLCIEGDVVLARVPAVRGEPGFDAMNEPIEADPPASVDVEVGANVEQRDSVYVACVSGVVKYDGERIEVRRMLVIDRDVTANDPKLEFDGDLTIRASVRTGSVVKATGNITVEGTVEGATIESTGGDVHLSHGVAGHHQATIRADRDVYARFCENATMIAGRDITVDIGALHSRLIACGTVQLLRGRGQVIGGSAMAGNLIELKQAGANSGVETELHVGLDREVMEAVGRLDEESDRLRVRRDDAAELADKMERIVGDPACLTAEERRAYTNLRQVQLLADIRLRELSAKRDEVLAEGARRASGQVNVLGTLMPRVRVQIGDAVLENTEPRKRCRVRYEGSTGVLSVEPLR